MAQRASCRSRENMTKSKALDLKAGYISSELTMPSHDLPASKHHERHIQIGAQLHKAVPAAVEKGGAANQSTFHHGLSKILVYTEFNLWMAMASHIMS